MSAQPNQSLIDGLACLQALATSPKPIGCRELARDLELNPMRANRLLKTLAEIGLAQQDAQKRYFIGAGIHALAAQAMFGSGILKQALPLLKQIRHPGLTVAIGVLWREHVTYLFHGRVGSDLEDGIGRVGLVPFYRSSIGMLLLAQQKDEAIGQLWQQRGKGHITKADLNNIIKTTRQRGYACIENRSESLHHSLAVPLGTPVVAGLALSGMAVDEDIQPYVDELHEICQQISL